jgi:muramoyltetrapeptide carboxypeptidase
MKVSRRGFGAIAAASLSVPLPGHAGARSAALPLPVKLIKPPRLRPGDTVGLIAPGGYTSERAIDKAVRNIESLGLNVKQGKYLREVFGNYAGSVEQRVADLHAMFTDPEIQMIWPIRGGSGCISLLSSLDYDVIRRHPKILLGYSDISALHLAINKHAGLVTFHGPVASSTMTDYSRAQMMAVLTDPQPQYTIPMSQENAKQALSEPHFGIHTHTHGVATGALMGGNLSMVAALAGTPYAADIRGSILFLEEVNEAPYRIDRWMTQLDLAGGFKNAAAVVIGVCENCGPEHEDISLTLERTLGLHLHPLTIPAVTGYSIGHIRNQCTLPIGIRAMIDTQAQTITLLDAAVS